MDSTAFAYSLSSEKVVEFPRPVMSEEREAYDPTPRSHMTVIADDLIETIGEQLGDTCGWLYVLLERHANKDGWCDPSEELLATRCRRSVRWVRENLGRLRDAGFITIQHRTTRFGTPDTNAYTLPYHQKPRTYYAEGVPERSAEGVPEGSVQNRSAKVGKESREQVGKSRGERATKIPDDFTLTPERLAYATGRGLSPTDAHTEFEKLRNWAEAKAERKVNWDATWKNWVIRALEDRKKRGPSQQPAHVHTRGHVG